MTFTEKALEELGKAKAGLSYAGSPYADALAEAVRKKAQIHHLIATALAGAKGDSKPKRDMIRAMILMDLLKGRAEAADRKVEDQGRTEQDLKATVVRMAQDLFGVAPRAQAPLIMPQPSQPLAPAQPLTTPSVAPPGVEIRDIDPAAIRIKILPGLPLRPFTASDLAGAKMLLAKRIPRPEGYLNSVRANSSLFTEGQFNTFLTAFNGILTGLDAIDFCTSVHFFDSNFRLLGMAAERAYQNFNRALEADAKNKAKRVEMVVSILCFGLKSLPPPFGLLAGQFVNKAIKAYAENFVSYSKPIETWAPATLVTPPSASQKAVTKAVERINRAISTNLAIDTSGNARLGTVLEQMTNRVNQFVRDVRAAIVAAYIDGVIGDASGTRQQRAIEMLWTVHEQQPRYPTQDTLIRVAMEYLERVRAEVKERLNKNFNLDNYNQPLVTVDAAAAYFELKLWGDSIVSDAKAKRTPEDIDVPDPMLARLVDLKVVKQWSQGFLETFSSGPRGASARTNIFREGMLRYHGSTNEKRMLVALARYMQQIDPVALCFNPTIEKDLREGLKVYARTLTDYVETHKTTTTVGALSALKGDAARFGEANYARNIPKLQ